MLSENGVGEADPFMLSIKLSKKIKNSLIPLPFFPTLRYVEVVGLLINIERQAPFLLNINMR